MGEVEGEDWKGRVMEGETDEEQAEVKAGKRREAQELRITEGKRSPKKEQENIFIHLYYVCAMAVNPLKLLLNSHISFVQSCTD